MYWIRMVYFLTFLLLLFAHNNAELTANELKMFNVLANRVQEQANSIKVLEKKFDNVEKEMERQKEINRELGHQLESQKTILSQFRANGNQEVLGNIKEGNQNNTRIVWHEKEHVAFSAFLTHTIYNLGPGQIIQYGSVVLNEGNAYNKNTGIFTVPHDGVYLFSYACEDYHNHQIYADLMVDGSLYSIVLEGPSSAHNMGTNVVILRLKKGQAVWIAIDAWGRDNILQNGASSFSGVFLYY
ncbi:EMILIN-2-like [Ruditapes philippinarum]|uniref:EMILIN-2-like n=1 Tax=Ruditapes philippinarum TaxID=129788 RepID=UPI00295B59A9|nr:EMILIN-2-like [Ruditapes philippinarum]